MKTTILRWSGLMLGCMSITAAHAETPATIPVVIQGHRFHPAEIHVKAGQRALLVVENRDAGAEEFESHRLHRETILRGHTSKRVYIGPLRPGQYPFVGEFHEKTAHGIVVAE